MNESDRPMHTLGTRMQVRIKNVLHQLRMPLALLRIRMKKVQMRNRPDMP